jgi:hypothetical protein
MNKVPPMAFHYAIKFPDGMWYYGPTWTGVGKKAKRHAQHEHRGPIPHSYTYTETAAHLAIKNGGVEFEGCTVHRVLD